jgi:predicted RecA/RadA family phage recombinase
MSFSGTYIQPGEIVDMAAPYDRAAGEAAQIGQFFGVSALTVASGGIAGFYTRGVFNLTKTTGQSWSSGDLIYWETRPRNARPRARQARTE